MTECFCDMCGVQVKGWKLIRLQQSVSDRSGGHYRHVFDLCAKCVKRIKKGEFKNELPDK